MAKAVCDEHKPEGGGDDYRSYILPARYPDPALDCEVLGCPNPARLWLTADERAAFIAGERRFTDGRGRAARAADDLFPN